MSSTLIPPPMSGARMVSISLGLLSRLGSTHKAILHELKRPEPDIKSLIGRESLARLLYNNEQPISGAQMVPISFSLLTHLGLTHEAIIHELKGRESDVEILINRESLARLLYKIMVDHDDLRGGNDGNDFLWQRKTEEEVVQNLLESKPLTMWVEDLRCNGDKDVAKARDKRAVSTPANFPTAIEHRFFGRIYYPDKSTNAPALKEGGGDDENTLEVSSPEDDVFSGLSHTLSAAEGSAIGYNEVSEKKKRHRKVQKQVAKVHKQKKEEQDKLQDQQQKANTV